MTALLTLLRSQARAARLDASLLPLAEELNAQAAAAGGAAQAAAEAEAEAWAGCVAPLAAAADDTAPLAPPAAVCDAAGAGESPRALPPRPRAPWRASWGARLCVLLAALLALALHELAGLRILPRRGSAAFTAMAAACVALPLARALPTTTSRRRAALLSAGTAQQPFAPAFAPASPTRRRTGGSAAASAAQARAADAWLRQLAAERGDDDDEAPLSAAGVLDGADAAEVARVLRAADHFAVLNLRRDATAASARRAYRRAALLLHPDKTRAGLDGAPAAWERVQAAGAALADDEQRGEYAAHLWRQEARAQAAARSKAAVPRRRARRWAGLI